MAIPQIKNSVQPLDVISTVNDVVDNKGVDQTYNASSSNAQSGIAVAEAIGDLVPNTVKINGKSLDEDITLTAEDVSALPSDTFIPTVDQTYKASSTNAQSGTAVAGAISGKQDTLVSGINIKTINNTSILGEGNIEISGGGSVDVDQTYSPTSTNPQSGTAIAGAGFKTTVTASDVTIALGYTPYNATNPAGYTNNIGTVTSVNNIEPVDGNVTLEIPNAPVDQTYDATSTLAQSGTAVAQALEGIVVDQTYDLTSSNAQSGTAVAEAIASVEIPLVIDSVVIDSTDALSSGGAYINLVRRLSDSSATGSTTQGVYVDANGQIQPCTAVTSSYSASSTAPLNGVALSGALAPITTVIPSAASASNQLADKAFVNSSISTNTATFRGTFDSVAELEAYSGTKTNNDYAFVETTDSTGNVYYDRYKYNGTSWVFEYEINNTSFTSTQWNAINSGVTSSIVSLATSAMQPNTAITAGTHAKISYDERGLVTGGADLTMSDITTALGYTPYDSSNPNGFTDNTGTVTSVNNIEPVDGNVTLEIPSIEIDQTYNASSTNAQSGTAIAGAGFITSISSGDVTTALGYTPYDSSNPDGFITSISSGDVTTALGYTPYSSANPDGFISSISSGDVTTALGYTPYDNSNPDGFITSSDVGNGSIVFMQGSINKGTITANQTTDVTISLDEAGTSITVDTVMSDTSTNPVQNKVITAALDNYVPTSLTINGTALTGDIVLTASDVSALPSTTSISDLITTAQQSALDSGVTSSVVSQVGTNTSAIAGITTLIPSAATSSNQLADKAFVNSSIASNTANFIGTFDSVAELEAYSGTLTNNDYAFVETTDSSGNVLYDRYKYNGTEWLFEYELNNSSFTATQWAAINSGVDTTIVSLATNAVQANTAIVGGTHTKITYDSKGLVTAGADLTVTDITTALGYTPYDSTNPDGFISSISSGDVTTALGYTPYDSSNPDGFITSTAIGNGTIVFTQGGEIKGTITANQTSNSTIELDAGGGSTVIIDTSLDPESTNPVENRAIANAINEKSSVVFVDWSS